MLKVYTEINNIKVYWINLYSSITLLNDNYRMQQSNCMLQLFFDLYHFHSV